MKLTSVDSLRNGKFSRPVGALSFLVLNISSRCSYPTMHQREWNWHQSIAYLDLNPAMPYNTHSRLPAREIFEIQRVAAIASTLYIEPKDTWYLSQSYPAYAGKRVSLAALAAKPVCSGTRTCQTAHSRARRLRRFQAQSWNRDT